MAPADTTFYDLLEVAPEATPEELSGAYKKRALKLHPDKGGNAEQFKAMKAAYDVLKDPAKRQMYDKHGPAFVRFMDGDFDATMEVVMGFIKTASKIVLCSLPVVAALVFFPAIVFSLRWDGRISWHWAIAFIPAWTFQLVFVLILLKMRSTISLFSDAVSEEYEEDEEERRAKEEGQRQMKSSLSLAIGVISLLIVQEAIFALRLQGNLSRSWFVICIPYFVLEFFYMCGRVYIKLLISAAMGTPTLVMLLPTFLWLSVRLASVMLLAAKADGVLEIPWILTILPLLVAAGVRLLWSCYQSYTGSARTVEIDSETGEASEKGSGNPVVTFCALASWLVVVLLAVLKMDGSNYSAFVVFLPYFFFSSLALCCCACMACCGPYILQAALAQDQEGPQNPEAANGGANGSTPLINPQNGQTTSYSSVQAPANV